MEAFFHRLAAIAAWASANPLTALFYAGVAVSVLGTVANGLSYFPRIQGVLFAIARALGALVKLAGDVFAVVANARGRGVAGPLHLPGLPTLSQKSPLDEAQPKSRGAVPLGILFAAIGAFVAGVFFFHEMPEAGFAWLGIFAGLLFVCILARQGPALALAMAALGISSCSYVKATAAAVKTCAGKTVSDADWNDLKPTVDGVLHMDRSAAFQGLEYLAYKYGPDFVRCLVAELKAEYQHLRDAADAKEPAQEALAAPDGPSRAQANAEAWLSR